MKTMKVLPIKTCPLYAMLLINLSSILQLKAEAYIYSKLEVKRILIFDIRIFFIVINKQINRYVY